jgi:hypothetical protein
MSLERQMRRKAERNAEQLAAMQRLAQWAKAQPEADEAFRPGTVTHMCHSHDAHCKTLKTGNGFDCNCSPDISFHRQT